MRRSYREWWRRRWPVALARSTTLLGIVASIASAVWGDPTFNAAVQQVVPPAVWPYVVIAFGVFLEVVHRLPYDREPPCSH